MGFAYAAMFDDICFAEVYYTKLSMKSKRLAAGIGIAGVFASISTFGYLLGNNQTAPIKDKPPTVLPLPQTPAPVQAAEPPPLQVAPSGPNIPPPEPEYEESEEDYEYNEYGCPKNQYVSSYTRSNGTYVSGYWRNSPSDAC